MYDISDALPVGTVSEMDPGTSLLIRGPAMVGKRALTIELLGDGSRTDDGILVITTSGGSAGVVEDLERTVPTLDRDHVAIVDCSGSGDRRATGDVPTYCVSSPGDLTGISIGTTKLLDHLSERGVSDVRHGLVSLSTLLQYLDTETVFKFLHIYTNRIADTSGFGVFTLDSDSHDTQTVGTLVKQFDCVIELRETDAGEREMRARERRGGSSEWRPL